MVLADDLEGYWSLDVDFSDDVGSADGTPSGATHIINGQKIGNGAYEFDGSNDTIGFSDSSTFDISSTAFSIAFWLRFDVVESVGLFQNLDSSPLKAGGWEIRYTGTAVAFDASPIDTIFTHTWSPSVNTWHHVIITYDETDYRLYIDGEFEYEKTDVAPTYKSAGLLMGARKNLSGSTTVAYLDGRLDDIGIWHKQLSDGGVSTGSTATGEVAELYNSGAGLRYPFTWDITDDVSAHWALEDTSDSHGSVDITNNGATEGATGKVDDAFDFERDDSDYCSVGSSFFPSGEFSVSFWVNQETENNYQKVICVDKSESGSYPAFGIERSNGDKWRFTIASTSNSLYYIDSNSTISASTWYHLVCTYNSATGLMQMYVDGTLQTDTDNLSGTRGTATGDFLIGAGYYNGSRGSYFDGIIDEVTVWDRIINQTEVTTLYNSGSGIAYPWSGTPPSGWTGTINGVSDPTKVISITVASIETINGV